jgi:hypothetical protein
VMSVACCSREDSLNPQKAIDTPVFVTTVRSV